MDLYTASSLGLEEVVKIEASRNLPNILKPNSKGWTPIMYACIYCQEKIVALLLKLIPSCIHSVNKQGQMPLMLAAESGNLNIIKMLTKPEILECKDEKGWTALFYAVYYGHVDIIRYLITYGANVNARDYESRTVLIRAIESRQENVIELLVAYGANYDFDTNLKNIEAVTDPMTRQQTHFQLMMLLNITAVTNLDNFLHIIGLDEYSEFFKEKKIDLNKFLRLTENDLKLMGICKFGPRRKMALAAAKYNYLKDLKKDLQTDSWFYKLQ